MLMGTIGVQFSLGVPFFRENLGVAVAQLVERLIVGQNVTDSTSVSHP